MKKVFPILLILGITSSISSAQNYRLWASYYGGSGQDIVRSVTTDASGNVYVAGYTNNSSGLATTGAHQTSNAGAADAFLVKFDGAGTRLWATYYGGSDGDLGYGVKTDAAGNVYLGGYTYSTTGIATAGAYQTSLNGAGTRDAFLVKFNSSGVRQWATYYGGESEDKGTTIATDPSGNVYLAGETYSTTGIAMTGEFQDAFGAGPFANDGFLVKFSSTGARLWGTYYGGDSFDEINSVTTDASGNVIIAGPTMSPAGIASPGAFKTIITGYPNAFVAKFNSSGTVRLWGTYYGGIGPDVGWSVATDGSGNIFLAGTTQSSTGIASGGFQNTIGLGNTTDAFLVKFNAAGAPQWGTYYGGDSEDEGTGVATDAFGNVFLSGDAYSLNNGNCIATANGFQTSRIGGLNSENQFLAVFSPTGIRYAATYYGSLHEEDGIVAVNVFGDVYLAGTAMGTTGIASGGHQNTYGGGTSDGYLVKFATAAPIIEVNVPNPNIPPTPTTSPPIKYYTISLFHGGTNAITNAALKNFSPGSPLPTTGTSTVTFTCDFTGTFTGSTSFPIACTATGQMKATYSYTSGSTKVYDTEILQLELSGGTLPTGVKLRESPTLSSTGELVITSVSSGLYHLASFFDVVTELSTDNGSSWQPSAEPASRLDLQNDTLTSVPTLSEWGLIALSVLVLGMGMFFVNKRIV